MKYCNLKMVQVWHGDFLAVLIWASVESRSKYSFCVAWGFLRQNVLPHHQSKQG